MQILRFTLVLAMLLGQGFAQRRTVGSEPLSAQRPAGSSAAGLALLDLPQEPGVSLSPQLMLSGAKEGQDFLNRDRFLQSRAPAPLSRETEPYHWKGLLLQSLAFSLLENGTRIVTADQDDRHILLNKPFWSDYWASLGQFNMRRWNDGDSFEVNYIGHPMEGAIAGYLEVQNDPRGRDLVFSRDRRYWNSRFRAFLWATTYSVQAEIGPLGEAGIFNEGGFTYPLGCKHHNLACEAHARYTNNTGWVDFIITPVAGTLLLIAEDAIDRFVTDGGVQGHPYSLGHKLFRDSLNPARSLANLLRGHVPSYRDYEHPGVYESVVVGPFERALEREPKSHVDINLFYSSLGLRTNHADCSGCRTTTTGAGTEIGFHVRRYLDLIAEARVQPGVSPVATPNIGGTLLAAHFGIRSGYSGKYFALRASLAPGFASYSHTVPAATAAEPQPDARRNFNFSAVAAVSGDVRFTNHLAFRASVEQMLIRYKSADRDPDGIGSPPRLSFLSHDNYINSTNWGVRIGPVFRF